MDQNQIKKNFIPALAIAAIIVFVGLLLGLGGNGGDNNSGNASNSAAPSGSGDGSDAGMSNDMPPTSNEKWIVQPSGLKIWEVSEGTGAAAQPGGHVVAHYTGWLASNARVFDSSRKRGESASFSLKRVIKGWQEGIPGMKVGGIRRLYIPSNLGYGSQGMGRDIPPDADLIFEVKLVGVQ